MIKFDIGKVVNRELLIEELQAVLGERVILTSSAVMVDGGDDDFQRAQEIVAAHNPNKLTKEQKQWNERQSQVRSALAVIGLKRDATFDEFARAMQDLDRMAALLWLLWLLEHPDIP